MGVPIAAVALNPERWMTSDQLRALERLLLPGASPGTADSLTAALRLAETVCLDTALLGLVLAHQSGEYVNRLYKGEFGWTAKNEAGWPNGLWLPPAELDAAGERVLRARTLHGGAQDAAIDWARWQLRNWWRLACAFAPDAALAGINDAGEIITTTTAAPLASASSVGELIYLDPEEHELDGLDSEEESGRCAVRWPVHVANERVRATQDRRCIFACVPGRSTCRLHLAIGGR